MVVVPWGGPSFEIDRDENGNLRITDAATTGGITMNCPKCGLMNRPVIFSMDVDSADAVGRRYWFCCPNCLIHYSDWGGGPYKKCKTGGNHEKERWAMWGVSGVNRGGRPS